MIVGDGSLLEVRVLLRFLKAEIVGQQKLRQLISLRIPFRRHVVNKLKVVLQFAESRDVTSRLKWVYLCERS